MSDVSSSLVGNNDFMKGGAKDLPTSTAFPGNSGATWQSWQSGDELVGDEPVPGVVGSGRVSGGILPYPPDQADPFPGARPPGTQGSISTTAPGWFVDRQPNATDYDVGPSSDVSTPSRPWQSGGRPSDIGIGYDVAFPGGGQIPPAAVDTTGETGPRRLRADDSDAGAVLP